MASDIWRWDAIEIARGVRLRRISSREAVESCLARLEAVNQRINAVIHVQADAALAAADAADAAVGRGDELGPLHGVPITLKDLADQAGIPTVHGVAAFRDRPAPEDSPVVKNLRKAGAVIVGRTNVPPLSARWDTANAVYGRTWNPWSRARTPGGSSGGAAAALACGIGALAHGSDLGGSIRYPAYCCGIAGLRPTMGRVPQDNGAGGIERPLYGQMIAVHGPMARRVRDLRLGLAAMSAGDPRDPFWVPAPLEGQPRPRPLKVALVADAPGLFVHPAVRQAVLDAGKALAEAGYLVEEVATPSIADAAHLWAKLGSTDTRTTGLDSIRKLGDEEVIRVNELYVEVAPRVESLAEYLQAMAQMVTHRRAWSMFLSEYPLVVGPNSGDLAFTVGFETRDAEAMRHLLRAQALMTTVNLLGLPAVAVPTGLVASEDAPHGLPVGVQVIASRFREDLALDAAEAIEARRELPTPIDPTF